MSDKPEQPWMDSARSVLWDYDSYIKARTPLDAANYLVELANSMSQLVTWLPEYDERTGWLLEEDQ